MLTELEVGLEQFAEIAGDLAPAQIMSPQKPSLSGLMKTLDDVFLLRTFFSL